MARRRARRTVEPVTRPEGTSPIPALAAPYPKRFSAEPHGRGWRARWQNDPTLPGSKRGSEPFATEDDARLFITLASRHGLDRALTYVRGEQPPAPIPQSTAATAPFVGFSDLVELFLQQWTSASARTRADGAALLRHHALPYFGNTDVALIPARVRTAHSAVLGPDGRPLSVANFVGWLQDRHALDAGRRPSAQTLSPKTVQNIVSLVGQVFRYAVDEDEPRILRNPCRAVQLPGPQDVERPHLEPSAYRALAAAIDPHFLPLLAFLVGTGVRWGEAAGLQRRHLHLDPEDTDAYVDIRVACRKGAEGGRELGRLKSRASRRTIPLPPVVVELLRPLVQGLDEDDRVFAMRGGANLHHRNFDARFFKPAVAQCGGGVPAGFTIHGLRHTHATWLLNSRCGAYVAMRRLGHADIGTTQRYYGHLMQETDGHELAVIHDRMVGQSAGAPPTPTSPARAGRESPWVAAADHVHLKRGGGELSADEQGLPEVTDRDLQR